MHTPGSSALRRRGARHIRRCSGSTIYPLTLIPLTQRYPPACARVEQSRNAGFLWPSRSRAEPCEDMHQSCLPHQGRATRGVKPRTSLTQTTFAFFSWKMGRSCAQALFDAFAESSYVILHNTNYASNERARSSSPPDHSNPRAPYSRTALAVQSPQYWRANQF